MQPGLAMEPASDSRCPCRPGAPRPAYAATGAHREVARLAPEHLTVAIVDEAAHAVNLCHPMELAGVIGVWLDDAVGNGTRLPEGVRVVATK